MPVYEYSCPSCKDSFELLRPIHKMDDRADCPTCAMPAGRKLSVFAAVSVGANGASLPMAGMGGGCCGGSCGCSM